MDYYELLRVQLTFRDIENRKSTNKKAKEFGSSAEFVGKTHETTAYGKVEKPRQKAAGLFHFSTGPAEISFYKEIKEKQKML